jgi:hypothetical protein
MQAIEVGQDCIIPVRKLDFLDKQVYMNQDLDLQLVILHMHGVEMKLLQDLGNGEE